MRRKRHIYSIAIDATDVKVEGIIWTKMKKKEVRHLEMQHLSELSLVR